ncbi:MAG: hypothetical protein NC821_01050 [Candidatus Omnitrophica bacterium]|nr:hypothetical protein [Candidatus Omnitrophota bacterium]
MKKILVLAGIIVATAVSAYAISIDDGSTRYNMPVVGNDQKPGQTVLNPGPFLPILSQEEIQELAWLWEIPSKLANLLQQMGIKVNTFTKTFLVEYGLTKLFSSLQTLTYKAHKVSAEITNRNLLVAELRDIVKLIEENRVVNIILSRRDQDKKILVNYLETNGFTEIYEAKDGTIWASLISKEGLDRLKEEIESLSQKGLSRRAVKTLLESIKNKLASSRGLLSVGVLPIVYSVKPLGNISKP